MIDLYCIDYDDSIKIAGTGYSLDYEKLEVVFAPCNYLHSTAGYLDRPVPDTCIGDLEKQLEYLGNMQITVLYNDEEFNQAEYGSGAIHQSSKFFIKQLRSGMPTVYNLFLASNELEDDSDFISFGLVPKQEFN